jgi:hypothetical protein
MKHLKRFNENTEETHPYAIHMRKVYQQVLDTIKECFIEFEDNGWSWIENRTDWSGDDMSISIWGFPNFNCRMIPKEDVYITSGSRTEFVDMTGRISSDGEITWDSQEMEFEDNPSIDVMTKKEAELEMAEQDKRKKKITQEFDDFLVAVKRIQSEIGVYFKFSYNNKGGEWRIIIQGAV